jgi:hypothetical protein
VRASQTRRELLQTCQKRQISTRRRALWSPFLSHQPVLIAVLRRREQTAHPRTPWGQEGTSHPPSGRALHTWTNDESASGHTSGDVDSEQTKWWYQKSRRRSVPWQLPRWCGFVSANDTKGSMSVFECGTRMTAKKQRTGSTCMPREQSNAHATVATTQIEQDRCSLSVTLVDMARLNRTTLCFCGCDPLWSGCIRNRLTVINACDLADSSDVAEQPHSRVGPPLRRRHGKVSSDCCCCTDGKSREATRRSTPRQKSRHYLA